MEIPNEPMNEYTYFEVHPFNKRNRYTFSSLAFLAIQVTGFEHKTSVSWNQTAESSNEVPLYPFGDVQFRMVIVSPNKITVPLHRRQSRLLPLSPLKRAGLPL